MKQEFKVLKMSANAVIDVVIDAGSKIREMKSNLQEGVIISRDALGKESLELCNELLVTIKSDMNYIINHCNYRINEIEKKESEERAAREKAAESNKFREVSVDEDNKSFSNTSTGGAIKNDKPRLGPSFTNISY